MFGAINVDLLATASEPAAQDDSTPGTLRSYAGGVGRNIAENLARLGVSTQLVSAIGDDQFGRQVLADLRVLGVDVSSVSIEKSTTTASYTAVQDDNGELLHAISDMRIFDDFQLPVTEKTRQIIDAASVVVVDANLPVDVLAELVKLCDAKKIVADSVSRAKCRRLAGILKSLSLLKVNRAEAVALTGCTSEKDDNLLHSLHELGPEQVLLTSGEEGVVLSSRGEIQSIAALPDVKVVSTSGAGDAMLSGVIAAQCEGLSALEQLQWGSRAAYETLHVHSACSDKLSRATLQN